MHVGIDQAGVDVMLGLDYHRVGRRGSGFGRLVAFVRQRQTCVRQGRFRATRRCGLLAFDGPGVWFAPLVLGVVRNKGASRPLVGLDERRNRLELFGLVVVRLAWLGELGRRHDVAF
jgi:hypothetical protein